MPVLSTRKARVFSDPTTAPTAAENAAAGYRLGDRWMKEDSDREYVLVDAAAGTWTETTSGGAGSGDSITVNGAAVTDADFDDATPAAVGTGVNVKWQKDAASPANVSAYVEAATTTARGVVELATDGESAANVVVQGNDSRLSNARTPTAHATSHQDGGSDELSVANLSGQLADAQKITVRKNTGADVGTRARLNLIEGANITLTVTDDAGSSEIDVTIAASGGGGGGTTGTAVVDFGAFPGSSYASVAVTGQAGIVAGSIVRAGIRPTASADHSADEHMIESLRVVAGDIIAGTGFTIHVLDAEPSYERVVEPHAGYTWAFASATTVGTRSAQPGRITDGGGKLRRIHGQFNLWWHWS